MKKSILALAISALPLCTIAEEAKPLATDIELGIIFTSGNTETSSFKGKIDLKQELTKFRNKFVLEALYKEDQFEEEVAGETVRESRTTAEKYFFSGQSDYKLNSKHKGLFVFGSYEEDKFSGFEYQSTLAIGYSDRLFNFDRSHLDYSVGPGVSFISTEDTADAEGEETSTGVIRVSFDFLYKISENAKFTQTLSSDIAAESGENTKTKAQSALTANLTKAFALKASFTVDQNSRVPNDREHADTQTALTFVYSF